MRSPWRWLAAFGLLAGACASVATAATSNGTLAKEPPTSLAPETAEVADEVVVTTTPTSTTAPPASTTTAPPPTTVAPEEFWSTISPISSDLQQRMTASWREGCPVALENLRYLNVAHWDFDGRVASGELVVHADHAENVSAVMLQLFDLGYPIQQMRLVDEYGADDDASMEANNTSAFNCREVAWRPGVWSNHAFGTAIDVNPLINPYVKGATVFPPAGRAYADRSQRVTGGLYPGDPAVEAFASIGWGWGGNWDGAKDWQHFSASGR
ncbi:MAG: M15 family metallopeptidase [Acidimicrobiales bacterium]|nr:M15 family metallopeptidase [Acidimicrobiales bacterium]